MSDQPYIIKEVITEEKTYNPHYGDRRMCKCGHEYGRHFDSYGQHEAVGCKYCGCTYFEEAEHLSPEQNYVVLAFHPNAPKDVDTYCKQSRVKWSAELMKSLMPEIYNTQNWTDPSNFNDITVTDSVIVMQLGGYIYYCIRRE